MINKSRFSGVLLVLATIVFVGACSPEGQGPRTKIPGGVLTGTDNAETIGFFRGFLKKLPVATQKGDNQFMLGLLDKNFLGPGGETRQSVADSFAIQKKTLKTEDYKIRAANIRVSEDFALMKLKTRQRLKNLASGKRFVREQMNQIRWQRQDNSGWKIIHWDVTGP